MNYDQPERDGPAEEGTRLPVTWDPGGILQLTCRSLPVTVYNIGEFKSWMDLTAMGRLPQYYYIK